MKITRNNKKAKFVAITLCVSLLVSLVAGAWTTQAASEEIVPGMGYLRSVKANYLTEEEGKASAATLAPNSKWREEPLGSQLVDALENDLTDTSGCEQVWVFKASEHEAVRRWCLDNLKGQSANQAFLSTFEENREQR